MATKYRQKLYKFTDQLKTLINTFNQKPYPDYATKWRLAFNNTEEPRIQIWFQNQRARTDSRKDQNLRMTSNQPNTKITLKSRFKVEKTVSYQLHSSQLHTLIKAFMHNSYHGIDSREQLAKEARVTESRIQIWFQNFTLQEAFVRHRNFTTLKKQTLEWVTAFI